MARMVERWLMASLAGRGVGLAGCGGDGSSGVRTVTVSSERQQADPVSSRLRQA